MEEETSLYQIEAIDPDSSKIRKAIDDLRKLSLTLDLDIFQVEIFRTNLNILEYENYKLYNYKNRRRLIQKSENLTKEVLPVKGNPLTEEELKAFSKSLKNSPNPFLRRLLDTIENGVVSNQENIGSSKSSDAHKEIKMHRNYF